MVAWFECNFGEEEEAALHKRATTLRGFFSFIITNKGEYLIEGGE